MSFFSLLVKNQPKIVVYLCFAALLVAGIAGAKQWYLYKIEAPLAISVSTKSVAILPPHEHKPGDAESDVGHGVNVFSVPYYVPEDMWVTDIGYSLENAPGVVLHHAGIFRMDLPNSSCPGSVAGHQLLTQGYDNYMHRTVFPAPYGLFLPKGTELIVGGMLHNAEPPIGTGQTYKDVSIKITLNGVRPGFGRSKALDYKIMTLSDVPDCLNVHGQANEFTVPAYTPQFVIKPREGPGIVLGNYTFPTDALLFGRGAHLHTLDGAKELSVFLNGKLFETFSTHLTSYFPPTPETEFTDKMVSVQKGDHVSISALYSNSSDVAVRGAMAEYGFYYYTKPKCSTWYETIESYLGLVYCSSTD